MSGQMTNNTGVRIPGQRKHLKGLMSDRVGHTSAMYWAMCTHVYVRVSMSICVRDESLCCGCTLEIYSAYICVLCAYTCPPPTRQPVSLPSEVHLPLKQLPQGIPAARSPV